MSEHITVSEGSDNARLRLENEALSRLNGELVAQCAVMREALEIAKDGRELDWREGVTEEWRYEYGFRLAPHEWIRDKVMWLFKLYECEMFGCTNKDRGPTCRKCSLWMHDHSGM